MILSRFPQSSVVFSEVLPREKHGQFNDRAGELNKQLQKLSKTNKAVQYMTQSNLVHPRHRYDNIHIRPSSIRLMAQNIKKVNNPLLGLKDYETYQDNGRRDTNVYGSNQHNGFEGKKPDTTDTTDRGHDLEGPRQHTKYDFGDPRHRRNYFEVSRDEQSDYFEGPRHDERDYFEGPRHEQRDYFEGPRRDRRDYFEDPRHHEVGPKQNRKPGQEIFGIWW